MRSDHRMVESMHLLVQEHLVQEHSDSRHFFVCGKLLFNAYAKLLPNGLFLQNRYGFIFLRVSV